MGNPLKQQSILLKLGVFSAFCLLLAVVYTLYELNQGEHEGVSKNIIIPKGTSLQKVARLLEQEKVIDDSFFFKLLLRFTQGGNHVRAGEFSFRENMRPLDALRVLYYAEPIYYKVTVPEGWNVKEIGELLAQKGLIRKAKFVNFALSQRAADVFGIRGPNLEGYLFPDTYHFTKLDGEAKILKTMVKKFFEVWEKYKGQAQRAGKTMEEVVTLASIVEKETGVDAERRNIASVFENRLKKHMRLQSDPTTIYGIVDFNGNLTKRDLLTPHPYNTYTIPGLPPGPIASPGEPSIAATLNPAQTNYLYFVSNNNGEHMFSATYREHASHVDNYQKGIGRKKTKIRKNL